MNIVTSESVGYNFYRPHPKDDGRLYFQSVHTCGGGGGTPSQVWVGVYPISGLGRGVRHLRSGGVRHLRSGGVPHPRSGGVPHPRPGWWGVPGVPLNQVWIMGGQGTPPNQVRMVEGGVARVPPWPGLDGGGVPPPDQVWMGYPPQPGLD